jgi:hypothetical protein
MATDPSRMPLRIINIDLAATAISAIPLQPTTEQTLAFVGKGHKTMSLPLW